MATYGRFETVEPLHQGMLTTVSTAVPVGATPPRGGRGGRAPYVVKVFLAARGLDGSGGGHDVFVSYDPADRAIADAVVSRLQAKGARCRLAPREGAAADNHIATLDDVQGSQTFVVIVSKIADASAAVPRESEWAAATGLPIHALRLDDTEPTGVLAGALPAAHWVDAKQNPPAESDYEVLVAEVIGDVRGAAGGSSSAGSAGTSTDGTTGREAVRASEFLAIANLQKELTDKGAKHWAPIHEVGTSAEGPFYVTDNYTRTAAKLISFKVAQTSGSLHNIVSSVLAGLAELKTIARRPHGNLKPNNVLLTRRGRNWRVFLNDPGTPSTSPAEGEAGDLRAVGELIYQLVLHAKVPSIVQSVGESPEWARLGKRRGEAWRELCSTLLNPARGARLSLDELTEQVNALRPPTKIIRTAVLSAAAAVAISAGIVIPQHLKARNDWAELQARETWLAELEPALRDTDATRTAWRNQILAATGDARDEYLVSLVQRWMAKPREELHLTPDQIREINSSPPFSVTAMRETRRALAESDQLRKDLEDWDKVAKVRAFAAEFEQNGWTDAAKQLRQAVDLFAKRPPDDTGGIQGAIASASQNFADVKARVERAKASWAKVQEYKKSLAATGDKDLVRFPGDVDVAAASKTDKQAYQLADVRQSLDGLERALRGVAGQGEELVKAVSSDKWKRIDRKAFADRRAQKSTAQATAAMYEQWISDFRAEPVPAVLAFGPGYKPEDLDAARDRLKQLQSRAQKRPPENYRALPVDVTAIADEFRKQDEIYQKLKVERPADTPVEPLRAAAEQWKKDAAKVRGEIEAADVEVAKWEAGIEQAIADAAAKAAQELADAKAKATAEERRELEIAEDLRRRADAAVATIRQDLDGGLPAGTSLAVQDAWQKQLNALIEPLLPQGPNQRPREAALPADKLRGRLDGLKARYGELESGLPRLALKPPVKQPPWFGEASVVLTAVFDKRREERLAQAAKDTVIANTGEPVAYGHPGWKSFDKSKAQWLTDTASAQALLDAFVLIDRRLTEGYTPNEPGPADDAQTLITLADAWRNNELLKEAAPDGRTVAAGLGPVLDPLNRLMGLGSDSAAVNRETLLATLDDVNRPKLSVTRTAWMRLHELTPPWPATPADLDVEVRHRNQLVNQANADIDNGQRKQKVVQAIQSDSLAAFRSFFDRANTPEQVVVALGEITSTRLKEFGAPIAPDEFVRTLEPRMRFNYLLLLLVQDLDKLAGKPPKEVQTRVERFQKEVVALARTEQEAEYFKGQLAPYAERLAAAKTGSGGTGTSPTDGGKTVKAPIGAQDGPAGAKLLPWKPGSAAGNVTFTAKFPAGDRTLTFVRLPGKNTYLCTEEVSVGLFLDVAKATKQEGKLRSLLPIGSENKLANDQRAGPQVWEWEQANATGLLMAQSWFRAKPGKTWPAIPSSGSPAPTPDHPMTHLPAPAAATFAWLMNCRLPTPAEWSEAYKLDQSRPTTWNLRDTGAPPALGAVVYAAGVFKPTVTGTPVQQTDDGQVLPQPVESIVGAPFRHIVGNVAEFVFDLKPDEYKTLETANTAAAMQGKFVDFGKAGKKLFVIGGSAMWDPKMPVDVPQPLTVPRASYSDVGMRLAFDATGGGGGASPVPDEPKPPTPADAQPRDLLAALKDYVGQGGKKGLLLAANQ